MKIKDSQTCAYVKEDQNCFLLQESPAQPMMMRCRSEVYLPQSWQTAMATTTPYFLHTLFQCGWNNFLSESRWAVTTINREQEKGSCPKRQRGSPLSIGAFAFGLLNHRQETPLPCKAHRLERAFRGCPGPSVIPVHRPGW